MTTAACFEFYLPADQASQSRQFFIYADYITTSELIIVYVKTLHRNRVDGLLMAATVANLRADILLFERDGYTISSFKNKRVCVWLHWQQTQMLLKTPELSALGFELG